MNTILVCHYIFYETKETFSSCVFVHMCRVSLIIHFALKEGGKQLPKVIKSRLKSVEGNVLVLLRGVETANLIVSFD